MTNDESRNHEQDALPRGYVLYRDEFVTLVVVPSSRILWHRVHRYARGEPFRSMLEAGRRWMLETGGCKWLSDNRNNNAMPPSDERWIHDDWFPRAVAAGWRYWAVVPPRKVLGQMNMRRYAAKYERMGLVTRLFEDTDSARRWLEAQGSVER